MVKFALVGDHAGVGASRRDEVVLADEFADPGPRDSAQVEQRDAAVSEVVRGELRHASRGAGTSERSAKAVAAEALEDRTLRQTILARHKPRNGLESSVGTGTHRARPVFATAPETRQRCRGSSTSPQVRVSSA